MQHASENEADTKLQELKAEGDEAWKELTTDTEKSWTEDQEAFQSVTSKFK